ncbi:MAG: nucleoside kinase [Lachnospiraceae bacterium]|nr:nucleoside kinase [Lachnospiraceae bacterium]
MEQKTVTATINGEKKTYAYGTLLADIAKEYQDTQKYPIVLVTVNGKLKELHKTLKKDAKITFVTTADDAGHKTYQRSACLILLKAIYRLVGKEEVDNVTIHHSMGSGLYFTIQGNVRLDEEFLVQVKAHMQQIVDARLPIVKRSVSTDRAIEIFHRHHMFDKEKLFRYRRVSKVNIYSIGEFEDYFYGFMVHHTGYIQHFNLYLYDEGFVLQLPPRQNPETLLPFMPQHKLFQVQKQSQRWGKMLEISNVGELNNQITQVGIQHVLLVQEALHEAKISNIAAEIAAAKGSKKLIMVAGPSSSGKTTFSHRLSIQLAAHGLKPHPIGVDNYFLNREDTPLDEFGNKNYECLEAVDVAQFNKDMLELLEGKKVELPEFNFITGQREYKGNYLQLGTDDVLVIEGIHGLNDKLSSSLPKENKFKVYISALTSLNIDEHNRIPATDVRLIRRIVRDARTRGSSAARTISMWDSVRRGEEENIFPFQEQADVMFNSALIYELACLKVYAEPLLFGIDKDQPEYNEAKRLLKFFDYFVAIPSESIPFNSILREFVGGSCFQV